MFFKVLNDSKTVFAALIVSIGACLFSCQKEAEPPVMISTFAPTSGEYGSEVSITGSNFDPDTQNNIVLFGGKEAKVLTASASELVVAVPAGGTTGKITVKARGKEVTTTEDFTVMAGSWSSKADFSKGALAGRELFFSIGGNGYIHTTHHLTSGSPVNASFWMYSSANNSWVQKKEFSLTLPPGYGCVWGTADKGYILINQELWEYSPVNDAWVKKNALPVSMYTYKVLGVFLIASLNKACAVTSDGDWYLYNPVDDSWAVGHNAPFMASLNTNGGTRRVQGANDGGFLIIGKEVWKYTANINQWTQLPAFPGYDLDFTFGINNELYAGLAGEDYSANYFWVYKEAQNKWIKKAVMGGTYRYWPLYFTLNDKGYLGMGARTTNDVLIYDFHQYNP